MPSPNKKILSGLAAVLLGAVIIGAIILDQKNSKPGYIGHESSSGTSEQGTGLSSSQAPTSSASRAPVPVTEHDRELDRTLSQILASKNDNDSRLDTEFKHLSPGTKYLLKQKYASLPAEARNERGTIVFLLGRDLPNSGTPEDFQFFDQVGAEPPCRSLGDCSKETQAGPEDSHEESTIGTTLSYPQKVLLHVLQDYLSQQQSGQSFGTVSSPLIGPALHTLQVMAQSGNPAINSKAQELSNRYSHLKQ